MKPSIASFIMLTALPLFVFTSCKKEKEETGEQRPPALDKLYEVYKNGEIDECDLNGSTVFVAGKNAHDAAAFIYNFKGDSIGVCNYAWGPVDSICDQLQNCEVIYRCDNHITGQPPLDKYGLGN